jgi:hypothetical protein
MILVPGRDFEGRKLAHFFSPAPAFVQDAQPSNAGYPPEPAPSFSFSTDYFARYGTPCTVLCAAPIQNKIQKSPSRDRILCTAAQS